jgi:hypothetical protein
MAFITIDDIETHLRIDNVDEGTLLLVYIDAACEYVNTFTRTDWDAVAVADVPASVKAAALMVVGDLYENREGQSPIALYENKTVERLLWPYRDFTVVVEEA